MPVRFVDPPNPLAIVVIAPFIEIVFIYLLNPSSISLPLNRVAKSGSRIDIDIMNM